MCLAVCIASSDSGSCAGPSGILTADDPRPLAARVGAEGKRILVGAAITLAC